MFDQLKTMKALAGMMGNADEIKARFEQMQRELEHKSVSADAGAGAVRVTINGKLKVTEVKLDPAMTAALVGEGSEADREMIEELIVSATNAAMTQAQEMVKDGLAEATGGLNLPGLDGLLGA